MKDQIMRACELPHVPSHRFTDYNAGEESENARLLPLIEKLAELAATVECLESYEYEHMPAVPLDAAMLSLKAFLKDLTK